MLDKFRAAAAAFLRPVKGALMGEAFEAPRARFDVVCYDADGNEKWRDVSHNLVTTPGKNDLLDKYFAGSGYTAAWFCGLISSVTYSAIAATDTMASHAGWKEAGATNAPNYSSGTRPAVAFAAASAGSKATSSAVAFTFSAAGTIKGMFLSSNSAKDGATGVLYNAVTFTEGDRAVVANDIINVTITLTIT